MYDIYGGINVEEYFRTNWQIKKI